MASEIKVDTISEKTSANGVSIDSVTLKDSKVTADGGLVADNITIDGTEIDLSSGSLTIDVADDIVLDADGGTIVFKDGGTEIGFLSLDNSGFFDIFSYVSDNDLIIRGNYGV